MVTISDVAKEAGVSVSTVSRAINNSMLVSQEKKERVMEAIKKLGYKQIRITAARKAQLSKIIVFVTAMLNDELLDGARQAAESLGYIMVVTYVGETAYYQGTLDFIKNIPDHLIGGLIFYHNVCNDSEVWKELSKYPNVQIGECLPCSPLNTIKINDYHASYDMTSYLIKTGRKKIAFAQSPTGLKFDFSEKRRYGFCDALKNAGLDVKNEYFIEVDHTLEGGADVARWLYTLDPRPDSVVCTSDYIAVGCINELDRLGVKVPEEIAVTGFDSLLISESCNPMVTTVSQPFNEMGAEAVYMLDRILSNNSETGKHLVLDYSLEIREST